MRTLKYIFVHPYGIWNQIANARIRDEERSLGYFLGLFLKTSKIQAETFDGLHFFSRPEHNQISTSHGLLCIPVSFIESDYPQHGQTVAINEYLIQRVEEGLVQIDVNYPVIAAALRLGIDTFRAAAYQCHWVHKRRRLGEMVAELSGDLTTEQFRLTLTLFGNNKTVLYTQVVLETTPNEYSFKRRFKDVLLENNTVYITDFLNQRWFALDVSAGTLLLPPSGI